MWSSRDSQTLLVKMQNDAATLEDRFGVSYTTKYILNHVINRWYIHKEAENLCPYENLHTNVCSILLIAAF